MNRYLKTAIFEDFNEKMFFIGGPSQVGKTTLVLSLLRDGSEKHPAYLNGDKPAVRRTLLGGALWEDNETTCITYF